jgi:hypothetical protein
MNRVIVSVVAGAGLSLASAGTALASCPKDTDHQPPAKPAHHQTNAKWHYIKDSFTIPAGAACKVAVKVTVKGYERDPYTVTKHGVKYTALESKHESIKVTNTVNHRTVSKDISGDLLVRDLPGDDVSIYGTGNNVWFGKGVTGIVWTTGKQVVYVDHDQHPNQILDIARVHGKYVDLCTKVGTRGVPGKNPPPPPAA